MGTFYLIFLLESLVYTKDYNKMAISSFRFTIFKPKTYLRLFTIKKNMLSHKFVIVP